jgi:hypothetical protein
VRHVNSARERSSLLACRAASLPAAVLKSSGKLQHQPALRSPFETAAEGSGAKPLLAVACTLDHRSALNLTSALTFDQVSSRP